ncbi:MAG: hypothetical protein RLZZ416_658 [Candidatus Parcubacteria bacterium]|jgi:S-adenosylmethionine/arginine decarboxylase-like enzyme
MRKIIAGRRITSTDRGWIFRGCANHAGLIDAALGAQFSRIAKAAGFAVYKPIASRKFGEKGGVTVSVVIGESSLDVHTWPEFSAAHIRLFYSHYSKNNHAKAQRFLAGAKAYFRPSAVQEVERRTFTV